MDGIDNVQVEEREERDDVPVHLAEELRGAFFAELGASIVHVNVRFFQHGARVLAGFGFKE